MPHCRARRERLVQTLQEQHVSAVFFEDTEGRRDPAIRYFTGHPGDAVLIITAKGESVLCPWDENMAKMMADVDKISPLSKFSRMPVAAVFSTLQKMDFPSGGRLDIPPTMPYPKFLDYSYMLPFCSVRCHTDGIHAEVDSMRAIKDEHEIACLREAARVTDILIDKLESGVKDGTIKTETDAALLIERECRVEGCEGTGFDTLVANPRRSFGIHCFPPYTAAEFPTDGLSIIDFGVKKDGYTSDVTITFAAGKLSDEQERQLDLVQRAYETALNFYKPDISMRLAATKTNSVFTRAKRSMPHSLGHGIGLEAHEYPTIKTNIYETELFKPGMVVTLEPGLYSPTIGGCRLENDVLITESGNEVLTHSRIIRL